MPAPARKPAPAPVIAQSSFFNMCFVSAADLAVSRCSIGAAGFRPRSPAHDAGLSPCARNTIREAISRDTPSSQHAGHAVRRNRTRSAAGTFSGHRQRSRRICHQRCGWPSLSDDERLVEEHARSRGVEEPLVVGETRPTTPLVADPPTALAVTAEGASCAARAVPSNSVSCMLAARRVPTDLFPHGVPGAGREPSASLKTNASSAEA